MLAIIHTLIGGLIGNEFNSIILVALFSFVLHFIIDMLPHWDADFDRWDFINHGGTHTTRYMKFYYFFDMILALIMMISLYHLFHNKLIIFGAFVGIIPDLMSLGYKTKLKKNKKYVKFLRFHSKIQNETDWKKSLIIQSLLLIILIFIYIAIYF